MVELGVSPLRNLKTPFFFFQNLLGLLFKQPGLDPKNIAVFIDGRITPPCESTCVCVCVSAC